MQIYDALLSEKRILFSGSLDQSAQEIGAYVLAVVQLISPLPGTYLKVYPYAALDNLTFLDDGNGFVAGVTNPMFKTKNEWFDACCEVDVGKMRMA
jgi:hypothetical protein